MGRAASNAYSTDVLVRSQNDNSDCGVDVTDAASLSGFLCAAPVRQKMMSLFNGQERTITYLRDLLNQAGWKLTSVHNDKPSARRYQKVIAVPI